jgi:toxin ParE1/3/4
MPRKHRRVVWAPKSKSDLLDVWRYYQRVASPEIADRLLREIDDAGQRLADEVLMWRARDEIIPGLRSVLVHPYTVFYRINDSVV